MKTLFKIGLIALLFSCITIGYSEAKDFTDTKHQVENIQANPVVLDQVDVLINNSFAGEVGELKISNQAQAIETKKLIMHDLYAGYFVSHRTNLKGTNISYTVMLKARRIERRS